MQGEKFGHKEQSRDDDNVCVAGLVAEGLGPSRDQNSSSSSSSSANEAGMPTAALTAKPKSGRRNRATAPAAASAASWTLSSSQESKDIALVSEAVNRSRTGDNQDQHISFLSTIDADKELKALVGNKESFSMAVSNRLDTDIGEETSSGALLFHPSFRNSPQSSPFRIHMRKQRSPKEDGKFLGTPERTKNPLSSSMSSSDGGKSSSSLLETVGRISEVAVNEAKRADIGIRNDLNVGTTQLTQRTDPPSSSSYSLITNKGGKRLQHAASMALRQDTGAGAGAGTTSKAAGIGQHLLQSGIVEVAGFGFESLRINGSKNTRGVLTAGSGSGSGAYGVSRSRSEKQTAHSSTASRKANPKLSQLLQNGNTAVISNSKIDRNASVIVSAASATFSSSSSSAAAPTLPLGSECTPPLYTINNDPALTSIKSFNTSNTDSSGPTRIHSKLSGSSVIVRAYTGIFREMEKNGGIVD